VVIAEARSGAFFFNLGVTLARYPPVSGSHDARRVHRLPDGPVRPCHSAGRAVLNPAAQSGLPGRIVVAYIWA